jgi:tyrosine-protein kinase Etk/Wzc
MTKLHSEGLPQKVERFTPASPAPHVVEDELTFLDFLIIVSQRKKLITIVTVIWALSGVLIAFLLPVEYTATVIVLPPQGNSSMSSMLASQLAGMSSVGGMAGSALGLKNLDEMYVSMLKSRSVEEAVIKRYGLMAEYHKDYLVQARKALEKHAKIEGSSKDGLIRLNFSDQNPYRAAEIANGYVEQFRSLSQHLAVTEASQRRVIFETQLEKTKNDLANADEALKRTQLATGMVQVDSQARAMIESAAHLRAQVVAKQVQIEAMHAYAGAENPALTQAEQELDGLRSQFAKLVGSKGSGDGDLFLPKGAVPQAGLEYIRRLRDVKYYEAIFEILARQLELAKLDEAKEGAFIQVVDPAVQPEQKSAPKRGLITIAGIAGGFTFGVMLALLRGGLARMQHNPETRDKLVLLRALWKSGSAKSTVPTAQAVPAEPTAVRDLHPRPEATG